MPTNRWKLTIDLSDLWQDPDHPPIQRRDQIADRLRSSPWPHITTNRHHFDHLITGFTNPHETDPDLWWHGIYDQADTDRVWIDITG